MASLKKVPQDANIGTLGRDFELAVRKQRNPVDMHLLSPAESDSANSDLGAPTGRTDEGLLGRVGQGRVEENEESWTKMCNIVDQMLAASTRYVPETFGIDEHMSWASWQAVCRNMLRIQAYGDSSIDV